MKSDLYYDILISETKRKQKYDLQSSQQWDILDRCLGFVNKRGITVKQDGCLKFNRLQSKKVTVQFARLGQLLSCISTNLVT